MDQFYGRKFFHELGAGGMVGDDSWALYLLRTLLLLLLHQLHLKLSVLIPEAGNYWVAVRTTFVSQQVNEMDDLKVKIVFSFVQGQRSWPAFLHKLLSEWREENRSERVSINLSHRWKSNSVVNPIDSGAIDMPPLRRTLFCFVFFFSLQREWWVVLQNGMYDISVPCTSGETDLP